MTQPIISIENLSKKYSLGEKQAYYSFRDTISDLFQKPFQGGKLKKDEFWALKDISLDIAEGDVVGVIGRNGAGKSTLLKILSRITPPTTGSIELRGRVASLLEVGTGFHPELTGRENIYLNGAILGMTRAEIKAKFDEIVDFAEIEKFLDTPVKHYSSGMYMRLAFSVAAHLEPEILLVDEVLAVGDQQFQQKCLGKMSQVSRQGRTVIFVSHNMGMINSLCPKTMLLKDGEIQSYGSTSKIIAKYLSESSFRKNTYSNPNKNSKDMSIVKAYASLGNTNQDIFTTEDQIDINVYINIKKIVVGAVLGVAIKNINNQKIFTEEHLITNKHPNKNLLLSFTIPNNFLVQGNYVSDIALHVPNSRLIDHLLDVHLFDITDIGTKYSKYSNQNTGVIISNFKWKFK